MPANQASYSRIMLEGQYLMLDGTLRVTDQCLGQLNPVWDYVWYFSSASPYTIPMTMQTFSFTTGPAVDIDNHPVELTIRGQIMAD